MRDQFVGMAYRVAYHLAKLIKVLTKVAIVGIFHPSINTQTRIIIIILKPFKIIIANMCLSRNDLVKTELTNFSSSSV